MQTYIKILLNQISIVSDFNPAIDIVKTSKMIYNSTSEATKQITLEVIRCILK